MLTGLPLAGFAETLTILVREGLEALLVVAALAAFLKRVGAEHAVRWVYGGTLAALVASVAAAIVFEVYFSGLHDDRVEAVVMFLAAGLMLYMSGWLFLRQNPAAWTADLKRAAETALGAGATTSIALIAFLAVFREGAETLLFLHATARSVGGWSLGMAAGGALALVLLVALFFAMRMVALRLPLRPLFLATSAFLFVMGLRFVGLGIQECQEQTLIPYDPAPLPDWLASLGINPTWEALGSQAVLLAVAALTILLAPRPAQAQ